MLQHCLAKPIAPYLHAGGRMRPWPAAQDAATGIRQLLAVHVVAADGSGRGQMVDLLA
jgi:hypothetical protein